MKHIIALGPIALAIGYGIYNFKMFAIAFGMIVGGVAFIFWFMFLSAYLSGDI